MKEAPQQPRTRPEDSGGGGVDAEGSSRAIPGLASFCVPRDLFSSCPEQLCSKCALRNS